ECLEDHTYVFAEDNQTIMCKSLQLNEQQVPVRNFVFQMKSCKHHSEYPKGICLRSLSVMNYLIANTKWTKTNVKALYDNNGVGETLQIQNGVMLTTEGYHLFVDNHGHLKFGEDKQSKFAIKTFVEWALTQC